MAIVKVDLPIFTGLTTLELAVYQDGVRVNSDGNDALEETEDSFGRFTAEVSQSLSGTYEAVIVNASGAAVAFGYFDSTNLVIGRTEVDGQYDAILAKLSASSKIYTNPSRPNRVEVVRGPDGNAYDNTSWTKLSWDAEEDIDGVTFSLKVVKESERFDDAPTEYLDVSGTGSGQLAEPTVTNSDIDGLPTDSDLWFWLTLEYSATSHKTIAQGPWCVC
jgi:hypothetical protein